MAPAELVIITSHPSAISEWDSCLIQGWFPLATESESESQERLRSSENQRDQSRKRSRKGDGIGVARIRAFPFSSDCAYDSDNLVFT